MQNFVKVNSKSGIRAICAKLQSASIYVRVKLNGKFHEILLIKFSSKAATTK